MEKILVDCADDTESRWTECLLFKNVNLTRPLGGRLGGRLGVESVLLGLFFLIQT